MVSTVASEPRIFGQASRMVIRMHDSYPLSVMTFDGVCEIPVKM